MVPSLSSSMTNNIASNSIVIQNYHWDQVAFQDGVREHIKKHASQSREAMRDKILGE